MEHFYFWGSIISIALITSAIILLGIISLRLLKKTKSTIATTLIIQNKVISRCPRRHGIRQPNSGQTIKLIMLNKTRETLLLLYK
jgi:hypothetical protein